MPSRKRRECQASVGISTMGGIFVHKSGKRRAVEKATLRIRETARQEPRTAAQQAAVFERAPAMALAAAAEFRQLARTPVPNGTSPFAADQLRRPRPPPPGRRQGRRALPGAKKRLRGDRPARGPRGGGPRGAGAYRGPPVRPDPLPPRRLLLPPRRPGPMPFRPARRPAHAAAPPCRRVGSGVIARVGTTVLGPGLQGAGLRWGEDGVPPSARSASTTAACKVRGKRSGTTRTRNRWFSKQLDAHT